MSDQSPISKAPWLAAALVLSLAVNTFFVGLVVGGKATSDRWAERLGVEMPFGGPGGHHRPPVDLDPRSFTRMLPESAREDARVVLEARREEVRELFRSAGEARASTFEAMRAEPFDPEALTEALSASRAADEAASAALHSMMVEIVSQMNAEDRAQIGADLHERFPDMHERRERRERRRERIRGD